MKTAYRDFMMVENQPYLYSITYTSTDWNEAREWFKKHNSPRTDVKKEWKGRGFGCSSVRNGNLHGRNFDFFYNESADVIVHTEYDKSNAHYNSVGIASCNRDFNSHRMDELTEEEFAILPFALIDGINENGVACNVNVIPARDLYSQDEKGEAAWSERVIDTNPGAPELYYQFMVRFVLDNATSAKNAVDLLKQQNIVNHIDGMRVDYDGIEDGGEELHLMISDIKETYIVEIMLDESGKDKLFVRSCTDGADKIPPIMTNYYVTKDGYNKYNTSHHAAGVERYTILKDHYLYANSVEEMRNLMQKVEFSDCYSLKQKLDECWFSDISGGLFSYDKEDAMEYFDDQKKKSLLFEFKVKTLYLFFWQIRNSDDRSAWITVHTNVFDLEKKTMHLWVQEDYEHKIGEFTVKPKETSI